MGVTAPVSAAELMAAGLRVLRSYEEEINALNVFPVPDGDTGTNLVMTMQTVIEQLAQAPSDSLEEQLKAITLGSLMGARGNSGVILSQIIRGICEHLIQAQTMDAAGVAEALENGATVAYQAIRKPVEGTMLTVIRDAAAAGRAAVGAGEGEIGAVLDRVVREAGASVARTPDLLPVLKEAGVVDAGGYGLVALAEGIASAVLGRAEGTELLVGATGTAQLSEEIDLEHRYCTELVVHAKMLDADEAEEFLSSLGGSIMVAASPGLARVHVHTNTPGRVIDWAAEHGGVDQVKINDMVAQVAERARSGAGQDEEVDGIGLVAVANGDGVVQILHSLGVSRVVNGGQTMNPSAAELAAAADELAQGKIMILPNNANIVLTAQQVRHLTSKEVVVVPTKSIPEGFSAMLAFEEDATLQANALSMEEAAAAVRTCEVTCAVRTGKSGSVKFRKGDLIGICEGEIRVAGHKLAPTALRLLEGALGPQDAALTLVVGDGADDEQIEKVEAKIRKRFPKLDVDVQRGGQPLYPLIAGIE